MSIRYLPYAGPHTDAVHCVEHDCALYVYEIPDHERDFHALDLSRDPQARAHAVDAVVARWVARRERDQVNRRIRSVFDQAQEARWQRAQIQDPAIRDALSLT